jgi:hypothetical protein
VLEHPNEQKYEKALVLTLILPTRPLPTCCCIHFRFLHPIILSLSLKLACNISFWDTS